MKKRTKKKYQHSAFVQIGGVMKRIDVDAIEYIEALSYKCMFYMEDGSKMEVSMPMGEAIEYMNEEQIVRIYRSYCVNIDQIDEYYTGMVKMYSGKQVPIGRAYHESFEDILILLKTRGRKKM